MKVVVAILMGLFSGFLIYMMASFLFMDFEGEGASTVILPFVFFPAAALSIWVLIRGAGNTSTVFRRGFLLGAAEWFAMAFAGVILSGRAVSNTVSPGEAGEAGARVGGGIVAMMTGGISIFMAVVCLVGFAIAYFTGREMHDTTSLPTKRCPECAEMIQAEARRCRYCGAALTPEVAARA